MGKIGKLKRIPDHTSYTKADSLIKNVSKYSSSDGEDELIRSWCDPYTKQLLDQKFDRVFGRHAKK